MVNLKVLFSSFYNNTDTDFKDINLKKILELRKKSKILNNYFINYKDINDMIQRYSKIMELIHTNNKRNKSNVDCLAEYAYTNTNSEKLLLYMLSIDPKLEALIIYESNNTIKDIKQQILSKLGIFDKNLIKIEKIYFNYFLSQLKKEEIEKEIEKRVFQ